MFRTFFLKFLVESTFVIISASVHTGWRLLMSSYLGSERKSWLWVLKSNITLYFYMYQKVVNFHSPRI